MSAAAPPVATGGSSRLATGGVWLAALVALAGGVALVASLDTGAPDWWSTAGAIAVATSYAWALAARTGGRPLAFAALALAVGVLTWALDLPRLTTGAAVMTAVLGGVLGVMITVPARRFRHAVREVVVALVVSALGAMAAVGFEPQVSVARWEYTTLALGLGLAVVLVYRLGAGLHGLGRRGLLVIVVAGIVLAGSLAYGELLRRYGSPAIGQGVGDVVRWSYDHLGAFPRPMQALLGVPALAWGVHQRARRRQGWWACAFGVAATLPVSNLLVDPRYTFAEVGLVELYSLLLGLVIAYVVIRIDLRLTGSRGTGGRRAEVAAALRPEPPRTASL